MKLWSDSWSNGERIPSRYAAGRIDTPEGVTFSENLSPHLAWSELPAATRSLALICHDFDVPSRGDDVNQAGREVPADLSRVDFFHWVLADLPVEVAALAEGLFSRGFKPRGKSGPAVTVSGFTTARQGFNDYTGWFAANPAMAGDYFGYDGPFPPWNDSLVHHYVFTLYALGVARAPVEGRFGGAELRSAIHPYVLGEATHSGTYTLNRRLLG
jgi:Raf kinase inhibitor-like YbhB/YbcL family protein